MIEKTNNQIDPDSNLLFPGQTKVTWFEINEVISDKKTPPNKMKKVRSSKLVSEIVEVINNLLGTRKWSGDKPFRIKVENKNERYIYSIRRWEDRITIQERLSENPSLVPSFHLSKKGDLWVYDDPYLAKYKKSSLDRLQRAFLRLKVAIASFAEPSLDETNNNLLQNNI